MQLKDQKTKFKRLFYSLIIPSFTLIPISAISCSNLTSDPYSSESKTDDGQRLVRFHYPNRSVHIDSALWSSVNYDRLVESSSFDDAFKNEHAEVIKKHNDAYNEYHKPITNYDEKDRAQKSAKLSEARKEVIDKWQEKNIKLNKNKIFSLINSDHELTSDKYKDIKDIFKNTDFSKNTILVVNGLNYHTGSINEVVKGSGYWIKKVNILDRNINLEYKLVEIQAKGSGRGVASQALSTTSTIHYIVINKLDSLDNYNFTFNIPKDSNI
ncbi:hypothetical protein MBVR141_0876 [Mycoplasmopsis bovirhinis]|uniref:hypothetical protein n=1 Tax=Mycoplasmopsis bovirhinis TaxID=29553 RepID=UPI000BB9E18D|nr:hypothetical protein [Mycoplasmopsis bovirhinis]BBA22177.1 hypothetical protein MBVR141_0213 [Mycoplasmopsis bovirhinis]BBA22558.1 hypothetical protein MBVR141_0876 [Mycoplasmopsis bovirhinis]